MRFVCAASVICVLASSLPGTEKTLRPANQRFADSQTSEVPDFQRHVVPLLGRLGCNGRACHGSFQGRGGFRLSLFGYDFKMDHAGLTAQSSSKQGPRINTKTPAKSLAILKPSLEVNHEGGNRFDLGSWEHHILERWIAAGARGTSAPRELKRLEIDPKEVVFASQLKSVKLRVVAHWEDGTSEDVTPLCRFRTNDDSVVTVDNNGHLESVGAGDSHVIAFYDNGVASVPVMRPFHTVKESIVESPNAADGNTIDKLVRAKLNKLGIVASPACTDAEFLRRVSIDVTGTLPTPDEVERFLADKTKDKRRRKIDELLERPAYAAWWTNKLCDFTGCNPRQQAELGQETSVQWYMWIYQRVKSNIAYDDLIEQIVLAKSRRSGQTYDDYASEVSAYFRLDSPSDFSQRQTMPHYWTRRTMEKPEDKALAFAHNFLGIRLQCAQCHKHPFAPWTQRDFQQFSALFENVKYGVVPAADKRYRELAKQVGLNVRGKNGSPIRKDVLRRAQDGRTIPWRELYIDRRKAAASISLLRSDVVQLAADEDPRVQIMQWMKQQDNPWFARAFVNRVWAGYFHIGIVEPPDDLNPANPPSNPALLDWLADGFVERDFDMKWLHRQIVSSETYQRTWKPNKTNRDDRRNFSRSIPRRVPAEVVYDGLKQAVAATDNLDKVRTDLTRRATGHLSMWLAGTYGMHVFGKPERALNCDCERINQPTLLQSIFMHNDPLVEQRLDESGWITEISHAEKAGDNLDRRQLVKTAWLRTVNRPPTTSEIDRANKHLAKVESLEEGIRDLLWVLINTKEFILNR
ncbi:MAG: hypothetical protein CMJ78_09625 [Planctomycetaceae bacterium]|nr:hypothetical protein [Planctomycetaceae bacterium]